MSYEIELEDQGQDLTHLIVDEHTGEITDAGLHSSLYATGSFFVLVDELPRDRIVRFRKTGDDKVHSFNYLMTKLSLNGEVIASVEGVA